MHLPVNGKRVDEDIMVVGCKTIRLIHVEKLLATTAWLLWGSVTKALYQYEYKNSPIPSQLNFLSQQEEIKACWDLVSYISMKTAKPHRYHFRRAFLEILERLFIPRVVSWLSYYPMRHCTILLGLCGVHRWCHFLVALLCCRYLYCRQLACLTCTHTRGI